MKTYLGQNSEERGSARRRSRAWRSFIGAVALGLGACTGAVGDGGPGGGGPGGPPGGANPPPPPGNTTGGGGQPPPGGVDVNRVAIHRLNNREYDNTVRDLLGVTATAVKSFIDDEKVLGFDTIADGFGMTPAQYEQYFNAADTLVEAAFADTALRGKIMTCTPTGAGDTTCMGKIISTFGLRAWRRPLTDAEVTRLVKTVTDNIALGDDATGGVKYAVKAMLSSLPFLYRLEIDPDPKSTKARALNGYELASRLSYLAWSTMPDDQLFALAQSGELVKEATLSAQLDRMIGDGRANSFITSFAGQWLGMRELEGHQVDAAVYPAWNEPLRLAMIQEGLLYFQEFLTGGRTMKEFLTTDVNFVSGPLGDLYGMAGTSATPADKPMKVTNTTDTRLGFMGLGTFLTLSSFSYRTAPTLRGKWVLEKLLCEELPPPPANVPELDANNSPAMAQSQNVRARLEEHRKNPDCSSCHNVLDPIGIGLENFDAIGRYRTTYSNGDAIDSSGVLDKATFKNLAELTALLSNPADPRLTDCTSKTMMTYVLSRATVATDGPYLDQIRHNWKGGDLKVLLKQIVLNDTFRFRRGEPM